MATIYDVAKVVGISPSAVSAVLNDKPVRVSDATRQRILDAAKSLNYMPNRAAQQLTTGKFNTIALCFERSNERFFMDPNAIRLLAGIGRSASANGIYLLLAPTDQDYNFGRAIDCLPLHGVDGGIVVGPVPLTKTATSAMNQCELPLVCIDSNPNLTMASTVDADNCAGMKIGVEHLIANGHKKMVYIGGAPIFQCLMDRMAGFYEAIQEAGLNVNDQIVHVISGPEIAGVVRKSMETIDAPTAIICAEVGIGKEVLDEVMRLGLRVPDDLSVLVYDELIGHPLSDSIVVVRNNSFSMGEAACDMLNRLIRGECSGPISLRLTPELLARTGII